jgi:hypothetical protein
MKQDKTNPRIRGRQSPRVDLQSDVTVDLEANTLVGSGDNISLQGVFFTTDEPITVTVQVADHGVVTVATASRCVSTKRSRSCCRRSDPAGVRPLAAAARSGYARRR